MIQENISNWPFKNCFFRHGSDITLDVGVTAKRLLVDGLELNSKSGMGLVTSPDGDSHIILNSKCIMIIVILIHWY